MAATNALAGTAARMAMAVEPRAGGRPLSILIFHRVHERPDAIFPLEPHAAWFDQAMATVARTFHVLPLSEAVQRLQAGTLPPRAMAITFDDGYADNHDVAMPILRRHGLNACFFIATGFLNGGRMFNDTVIECIRHSPLDRLDLPELGLNDAAIDTPAGRLAAIERLLQHIKYLPLDDREPALAQVRAAARPKQLPDDLMMTNAQVQAMHAAGMEIGGHTVRHPILAVLDDEEAESQLRTGRETLEGLIQSPVKLLAYPNGRPDQDYLQRHVAIARRVGFEAAVTTAPGVARPGDDLMQLPRYTPWDPRPWRWFPGLAVLRRQRAFAISRRNTLAGAPARVAANDVA